VQHVPGAAVDAVDVREMVQTLVADLLPVADARSIDLGVKRFEAAHVNANTGELRMAVRNLVENALRYTPADGCVDIDVFEDAAGAIVRVTDTGPGIPEEALGRAKHGGSVSLENRRDGQSGLIASLVLPARVSAIIEG
jgi:two-component system OmpR family sensor kinase